MTCLLAGGQNLFMVRILQYFVAYLLSHFHLVICHRKVAKSIVYVAY